MRTALASTRSSVVSIVLLRNDYRRSSFFARIAFRQLIRLFSEERQKSSSFVAQMRRSAVR